MRLGPGLSAVIYPQDLDALFLHAIDGDVRQRRERKLSGSLLPSDTATMRPLFQGLDSSIQFAHCRMPVMRMVLFEIIANVL